MDVFYEESSITKDTVKAGKKYKIFNIVSKVFLGLAIFWLVLVLNMPFDLLVAWAFIEVWLLGTWFLFSKFKARFNVNYDYAFVSGELRIAKVFNVNKRKLITRLQAEDIIQMGDVENTAFENLRADPNTKLVFCTSNEVPAEDKFFMYLLVNDNGRKLYILECREALLMHVLRFVKRTVLESDYVSQEKKKDRV